MRDVGKKVPRDVTSKKGRKTAIEGAAAADKSMHNGTGSSHQWVELTRPNGMVSQVRSDMVDRKVAMGWGKVDKTVKAEYEKRQKEIRDKYSCNVGLGPPDTTHRVRTIAQIAKEKDGATLESVKKEKTKRVSKDVLKNG